MLHGPDFHLSFLELLTWFQVATSCSLVLTSCRLLSSLHHHHMGVLAQTQLSQSASAQ